MRKLILSSLLLSGLLLGATGCGSGGGADAGGFYLSTFGASEDEDGNINTPFSCGGTLADLVYQNNVRVRYPTPEGVILGSVTRLYAVPTLFSNLEKVTVRLTGYTITYRSPNGGYVPPAVFETSSMVLQSGNADAAVAPDLGEYSANSPGRPPTDMWDCLPIFNLNALRGIGSNIGSYGSTEFDIIATVVAQGRTSAGKTVYTNPLEYVATFRP